jgi:hypothetical protein
MAKRVAMAPPTALQHGGRYPVQLQPVLGDRQRRQQPFAGVVACGRSAGQFLHFGVSDHDLLPLRDVLPQSTLAGRPRLRFGGTTQFAPSGGVGDSPHNAVAKGVR